MVRLGASRGISASSPTVGSVSDRLKVMPDDAV